jgi:hypothetical protein
MRPYDPMRSGSFMINEQLRATPVVRDQATSDTSHHLSDVITPRTEQPRPVAGTHPDQLVAL